MFIVSKLLENISAAPEGDCNALRRKLETFFNENLTQPLDVILFSVQPTVKAPSQLLGAPLGSDVQLECQVEASPSPVSYWLKGTLNFLEFPSLDAVAARGIFQFSTFSLCLYFSLRLDL